MPSAAASCGLWIDTARPSKRTSPLSMLLMPAMHFTSVDLPAPLSPTRAVTSPRRTVRSTSCRTCTGPKLLFSFRTSRIASLVAVAMRCLQLRRSDSRRGAPVAGRGRRPATGRRWDLLDARLLALRLDAVADLRRRQGPGLDDVLDVAVGDDLRRQQLRLERRVL